MGEENPEKPFWAKFLRTDYLDQSEDGPVLGKVMDVLEGNMPLEELTQKKKEAAHSAGVVAIYDAPKASTPELTSAKATFKRAPVVDANGQAVDGATMRKEWDKIRSLEQKLGAAGKAEQAMAAKMQDHRMKMEAVLGRARLLEEEK